MLRLVLCYIAAGVLTTDHSLHALDSDRMVVELEDAEKKLIRVKPQNGIIIRRAS